MPASDRPAAAGTIKLFVSKDEHKFSCAHMTLFPDGTKEKLHGHNFRVAMAVELPSNALDPLLDFARIKAVLAGLAEELREHLLIPTQTNAVSVVRSDADVTELMICGKRYVIPSDEIRLLPVPNVVVEHLARYLWTRVVERIGANLALAGVVRVEVTVTEAPGQGASYAAPLPNEGDV
jgi:6-pyruvoyltetrahydropterin/6-carboxytetrahydropterin synthase